MKRNFKDSSFRYFFTEKANFTDLYYDISGKILKENEFEFVDLENHVINLIRNDIALIKNDGSLIVLIEHQSSNSYNMEVRLFLYYAYLLEKYINKTYEAGLHTYKKIRIPDAEFYILFNGKASMDDSEKYKTNFVIGEQKIDFKTKFQSINYDDLSKDIKARKDALDMYAYLIKRYFDNFKMKLKNYKEKTSKEITQKERERLSIRAFEQALMDCKKVGLYSSVFDREEFRVMSTKTLTYEESLDLQYEAGVYYGAIEGEKRGEEREKQKIALTMLKSGMEVAMISKFTKLNLGEIADLEKQLLN